MFCGERSIVKLVPAAPVASVLRCRRWTCPDCAPARKAEVKRLVRAGNPALMITLTSQRIEGVSPAAAARDLVHAWQLIVKRLKRERSIRQLHYFAVIEATRAGWPHLHILTRLTFIKHSWLSKQMAGLAGSPVVWLTRLRGEGHGAHYVAKYLGKAPHHFDGTKRYWRSQAWIVDTPAWKLAHRKSPDRWRIVDMTMQQISDTLSRFGYSVTSEERWRIRAKSRLDRPGVIEANWRSLKSYLWHPR